MIFSVDQESEILEELPNQNLSDLNILEREDLQEWVIERPRILGEELLVIAAEYSKFEDLNNRLDILAIDPTGTLVIIELKRDRADRTTDLQAIKYASYCATLTAEQIQQEYREFWGDRTGDTVTPEDVGQEFTAFLTEIEAGAVPTTEEGWAVFELSDKPRIILAAGSFGTEITAPVMWLIEEYGMDFSCVRIDAYRHGDRILLNSQQVIPPAEAEDYMTKRREKRQKQESSSDYVWTLDYLVENGFLEEGDVLVYNEGRVPDDGEPTFDASTDFWRAEFTGKMGQQNSFRWLRDGETYSITKLTKTLLHEYNGRDMEKGLHGYSYWVLPEYGTDLYTLKKGGSEE